MKQIIFFACIVFVTVTTSLAETYDERGHRVVNEMDVKVRNSSNPDECRNHVWMIEHVARIIDRNYGDAAKQTTHWMRLRMGEIGRICKQTHPTPTCSKQIQKYECRVENGKQRCDFTNPCTGNLSSTIYEINLGY